MAFNETRFLDDLKAQPSPRGGPRFSTTTVSVKSGAQKRNINWSQALRRYTYFQKVWIPDDWEKLLACFHAHYGSANGFRLRDVSDHSTTALKGVLGSGVGNGGATYQLGKLYVAGSLTHLRKITKPVSGAVTIYENGVAVTFGAGAGQVALDTTTGVATFVAPYPTGSDTLTWAGSFDVPVHFASDEMDYEISQVYPDGSMLIEWTGIELEELRRPL